MELKREKNRVLLEDESGQLVAEVVFPDCGDSRVVIERTFVAPEFRGQNIASQLMQSAYEEIKAQGTKLFFVVLTRLNGLIGIQRLVIF